MIEIGSRYVKFDDFGDVEREDKRNYRIKFNVKYKSDNAEYRDGNGDPLWIVDKEQYYENEKKFLLSGRFICSNKYKYCFPASKFWNSEIDSAVRFWRFYQEANIVEKNSKEPRDDKLKFMIR